MAITLSLDNLMAGNHCVLGLLFVGFISGDPFFFSILNCYFSILESTLWNIVLRQISVQMSHGEPIRTFSTLSESPGSFRHSSQKVFQFIRTAFIDVPGKWANLIKGLLSASPNPNPLMGVGSDGCQLFLSSFLWQFLPRYLTLLIILHWNNSELLFF